MSPHITLSTPDPAAEELATEHDDAIECVSADGEDDSDPDDPVSDEPARVAIPIP